MEHDGQWYYPHTDALGSIRRWSDASGQVVGARDYDPYGAITQQQGVIPTPLGFAGEWHDPATGLQYLRARWYQPATGRFTQVDPFPGVLALPATQHPYQYALNNPLRYTDPSGESVLLLLAAAGLYAAGGATYAAMAPDIETQGLSWWHIPGFMLGYENIRQDWKRMINPCVPLLRRAWAGASLVLNVALGITAVYGALQGIVGFWRIANQLLRAGPTTLPQLSRTTWSMFRAADTAVPWRVPGFRAIKLPPGLRPNRAMLLHEIAHGEQEFGALARLWRPLQRLSIWTIRKFGTGWGQIIPTYVLNPAEVHAAASGLTLAGLDNWGLFMFGRAELLAFFQPESLAIMKDEIVDAWRWILP